MTDRWVISALGEPQAQGSKRVVNGRLIDASKALAPWRDTVTSAGFGAGPQLTGPLACAVVFTMPPRPKSTPKRVDTYHPAKKPDLDKLLRAVFDAVTAAGLWVDDALVCTMPMADKVSAGESTWALPVPGVVIACRQVEPWGPETARKCVEELVWGETVRRQREHARGAA